LSLFFRAVEEKVASYVYARGKIKIYKYK